jgi:hypothetical protein
MLYLSMGPMAGGTKCGTGMVVLRSPIYQGTAAIKPISIFRWAFTWECKRKKARNMLKKMALDISDSFDLEALSLKKLELITLEDR